MPAPRMASTVCLSPASPKSCEWLLAVLSTVKPALAKWAAKLGGTWKAKQLLEPSPHLLPASSLRVPSRLPNTICASSRRSLSTAAKYVAGFGGPAPFLPSIVSPTAEIVNVWAGSAVLGGGTETSVAGEL